ncbi:hypothetical protein GYMLUDRAFT_942955 [Collybiopsis luxurians FD-317 M1]|uniref:Uncharacterized protein n=1 Tax=Collybiopsis luxurians FD-317 M1 TaxID=944289 RepID=A0A0D0CDY8_9AGAR|nr:hypothetical protein GYMLUDRAFT_942955 [Collybiopsis luxurians FD-317 M1]
MSTRYVYVLKGPVMIRILGKVTTQMEHGGFPQDFRVPMEKQGANSYDGLTCIKCQGRRRKPANRIFTPKGMIQPRSCHPFMPKKAEKRRTTHRENCGASSMPT